MNNTKILIFCAGEATRWNNYLGIPKQLIPIGGESLLERTVRLLHTENLYDITIISHDERLKVSGCYFYQPEKCEWIVGTLLSTKSLWDNNTIVLLGDVFFTEEAINSINSNKNQFHIYGRHGPSRYTYTPWGEIFAFSFQQSQWHQIITNSEDVIHQTKFGGRGKLWELYRSLAGFRLNEDSVEREIFFSIHDFTDDFDFPRDYDNNIRRYEYLTSPNWRKRIVFFIWIKHIKIIELIMKLSGPIK